LKVKKTMKNYINSGTNLGLIAGAALASGQGLKTGTLFGVVQDTAAIGELFTLVRVGHFEMVKNAGESFAVGDKIYWDDTDKNVTKTSTSNTVIGAATAVAATADLVADVLLDGVIR
jgi:predicted RecA/RadA family phage recombinase